MGSLRTVMLLLTLLPGAAAAQKPSAACRPGERAEADLGIDGWKCRNCALRIAEGGAPIWSFSSEPEVLSVRPGSPADGKLQAGDVIAAIDSSLITTAEAGRRLAYLEEGDRVRLTVRRGGKISRVSLVAQHHCREIPPAPAELTQMTPVPLTDSKPMTPLPPGAWLELQDLSIRPPRVRADFWPSGWFGFGISCRCSIKSRGEGEPILWSFEDPPEIYSVDPGSPAARAGLQRGDVLLEVDGVSITSEEGGRRFGAIRTGQTVHFEYRRGDANRTVSMKAESRPLANLAAPKQLDGEALREVLKKNAQEYEAQLALMRALSLQAADRDSVDSEKLLGEVEAWGGLGRQQAAELYGKLLKAYGERRSELDNAQYVSGAYIRYAGTVGDVDVEVRGGGGVLVTVVEEGKEIVIVAGDTRITLKREK